ncbi:hypothetical protein L7F22_053647 [Adiantum nelumboides]|nr:hypothetical protein [Adiantum nelumboides]
MSQELHYSSFHGERITPPKQSLSERRLQLQRVYCSRKEGDAGRIKLSDVFFERRGNKRQALTDDGARRVIKQKKALDSQLRKNQPGAHTVRWLLRSPAQMAQFLADGRINYRFNKYVDKAIDTISQLASRRRDSYDFGVVMNPWVGSLSFKDMCIILREQKNVGLACDFFKWMKLQGCYIPSVIPYTILLRKCGEARRFDLVEHYYTEMLEEGCEPDEVVISSLICIFGKSGRINDMMTFFSMMRSQGLVPPIVVLNCMLSSLYKAGLYNAAIQVWKELLAARVKPNDYTYAVIVNVFRKEGKHVEALDVFEEMIQEGQHPDEILYNVVIKMMGDVGRLDKILELYERMKLQGLTLSKHTYTYLVHFFSNVGKFQVAVAFFSEMQSRGFPADEVIYGTMISMYSKLGMFTDAEEAFKEMDEAKLVVSDRIFVLMARVRMQAGQFDLALEIFDEMQSRGFKMTRYAWIAMLQCSLKQQKLSCAESTFDTMLDQGFADALAFTWMFNLYKKLQMLEAGNALLLKLEKSSVMPDEKLYNGIISHLCNAGFLLQVDSYFSKMQMNGFSAEKPVKTMLMRAYGKVGRVADAVWIYQGLEQVDPLAISIMFTIYNESGNKEAALALFKYLLDCDVNISNKIVSKLASRGDLDVVEVLWSQMLRMGFWPSEETLIAIMDASNRYKQY